MFAEGNHVSESGGLSLDEQAVRAMKVQIRQKVLTLRDSLSEEERFRASLLLTERIAGHQWFYRADRVLLFAGFGSEIDTTELLSEALHRGKEVFLPRVEGGDMEFYRISAPEDLKPGRWGIPEPEGDTEPYVYLPGTAERTLMLMPGVAFDPFRGRLGYGRGFYDRYLAERRELQIRTIGIGYRCQLVERLPQEPTDIRPYQVVLT